MAEDLISSIIDEAAIKKQISDLNAELDGLSARIKNYPTIPIGTSVTSLKELTAQTRAYNSSQTELSNTTKRVLDAEKLAAIERKRIVDERIQQAKLEKAELQLQQTEIKKKALAEQQAAIESKKAAAESVSAGRERILQLRAEQEAADKAAEAERNRAQAEQQALSGTFNPGPGAAPAKQANQPQQNFIPANELERNVQLLAKNRIALTENLAVQKSLKDQLDRGEITQAKYNEQINKGIQRELEYKKSIADLTSAIKVQNREQDNAKGSLEQRRAALIRLSGAYDKLSATERASPQGQRLQTVVSGLTTQVKELEGATGRAQRNVGNYGNSFSKVTAGAKSAFSAISKLANLIPGLGIGGVFLLALAPLSSFAAAIGDLFKSISNGKEKIEALNKVNLASVSIYNDEKSKLIGLSEVAKDNNLSLAERQEALKQLIDISPQYLKGLTLENITTSDGTRILDEYILRLQKKAELQAAETVNAESNKVVADLKAQRQALIDLKNTGKASYDDLSEEQRKFFDNSTSIGRINTTASIFNLDIPKSDFDQAVKNIDLELKKAGIKVAASLSVFKDKFKENFDGGGSGPLGIIQKLKDQIEKLTKIQPTLLSEKDITSNVKAIKILQDELDRLLGKTKNIASVRESTKAQLDSDFEIYKIAQQRKIKLLEEGINDESKTFDERIALLQQFTKESQDLINAQLANDERSQNEKLQAQQANLKKAKGTERNNLLVEIENTRTAIRVLEAKAADERLKTFDENEKKYQEVEKSALAQEDAIRKAAYEKQLAEASDGNESTKAALARQFEQSTQDLNEQFSKGLINQKEYNKQREDLEFNYHVQSLRNELAYAKQILEIQKAAGIDVSKQQQEIAKLASDLEAIFSNKKVDDHKKQLLSDEEYARRKKDLYKQLYDEIQSTIFKFLDDGLTRQEQNLDEQQRLLDEDSKRKIANINQLGLTEVERVKQTSAIEKQAQFQTEQIEKRKRQIAVERAKYEKAASIASIISGTAQAIVAALKIGPPQGFVLAALTGAIGALQLAKAISTPLPKYKYGRGKGKEELAITGDGGVSEYIVRDNGRIEMTPDKPTLTHLMGGDMVYKDLNALTASIMKVSGNHQLPVIVKMKDTPDNSFELGKINNTLKNIEKKTGIIIHNHGDIKSSAWYKHNFLN